MPLRFTTHRAVREKGEGEDDVDWGKLKKGRATSKDVEEEGFQFKLRKVERPEPEALVEVKAEVVEEERERVGYELHKRERIDLEKRKSPEKKPVEEPVAPEEDKDAYQRKPKEPKAPEEEPKKLEIGKAKVSPHNFYSKSLSSSWIA